jgi:hypothetical protein
MVVRVRMFDYFDSPMEFMIWLVGSFLEVRMVMVMAAC